MMGYILTSGKTPEMAYTEYIPFSQEINPQDKEYKRKQKTCICTFLDVKILQRSMWRGLLLCDLGQLETSSLATSS